MAANSSLSLTSLDFDGIYAAQKAFLSSQSRFKDYNFDGSNMAALLAVLAHNTWLNAWYLNMAMAERWNDSAQLRNSLVSHAKELNYTPRSTSSASVELSVSFPTSGISTLTVPKGTQFSALNASGNHKFVTDRAYIYKSSNNYFSISGLKVYEGFYFTESFIVDTDIEGQTFVLSNPTIDTSSITLEVTESGSTDEYTRATTLYSLGPDSKIFFLQAGADGKYEVLFGNGIFGRVPGNGATVSVTYRVCRGADGNGMTSFVMDSDLGNLNGGLILSPVSVAAADASDGGSDAESLESIRFMSPRHYQTQERAVVGSDYNTMILENFPVVKDVNTYGGEDVVGEVQYGKVFVVCSSVNGNPISNNDKSSIIQFISDKNTLGITPVMADPDYLKLKLDIITHVNFRNSTRTAPQIKALVSAGIEAWNISNLRKFQGVFRQSVFTSFLNSLDEFILSNEVTRHVVKSVSPPVNVPYALKIRFGNEIRPGQITSSYFVSGGKEWSITDEVDGVTNNGSTLYLLENNPLNTSPNYQTIGNINYSTGALDIASLTVSSFLDTAGIEFTANPVSQDVYSTGNDIIEIDTLNYSVEIISD